MCVNYSLCALVIKMKLNENFYRQKYVSHLTVYSIYMYTMYMYMYTMYMYMYIMYRYMCIMYRYMYGVLVCVVRCELYV